MLLKCPGSVVRPSMMPCRELLRKVSTKETLRESLKKGIDPGSKRVVVNNTHESPGQGVIGPVAQSGRALDFYAKRRLGFLAYARNQVVEGSTPFRPAHNPK